MTETWADLIRRVAAEYGLHEPTDYEVEFVLWERTAFPFADAEHIERQVRGFMQETVAAMKGDTE